MIIDIDDLFDLKKIAESGQCFRVREFPAGVFRFITGRDVLYIRELKENKYAVSCTKDKWRKVWRPYFDLDRDYRAINRTVCERDDFLCRAVREGEGIRILRQDAWETLVTFIISQRKSIPAIRRVVWELCRRYGTKRPAPEKEKLARALKLPAEAALPGFMEPGGFPADSKAGQRQQAVDEEEAVFLFPTPRQLRKAREEDFRDCGAGYRAPYLVDAVRRALDGRLDLKSLENLPDQGLVCALESVRGVGAKVANCVALFAYGRLACAPVDTWIGKIIKECYGGRDPFPGYGAAAGIMQQYFFFYAQKNPKSLKG